MPETPLTTECRAIATNFEHLVELHGNMQIRRKMIYEHSATLSELSQELTTQGAPNGTINGVNVATQACGDAGEIYGNMNMVLGAKAEVPALINAGCDFIAALP